MDDKLEDLKGRAEEAAVDRARDKTKEILEETKSKIDDAVDALKARLRSANSRMVRRFCDFRRRGPRQVVGGAHDAVGFRVG